MNIFLLYVQFRDEQPDLIGVYSSKFLAEAGAASYKIKRTDQHPNSPFEYETFIETTVLDEARIK